MASSRKGEQAQQLCLRLFDVARLAFDAALAQPAGWSEGTLPVFAHLAGDAHHRVDARLAPPRADSRTQASDHSSSISVVMTASWGGSAAKRRCSLASVNCAKRRGRSTCGLALRRELNVVQT